MPEAGKGKITQQATSRKTQDWPQARGQFSPTGPHGDVMLLQNRIGNRATAELLREQAGKAPGIGMSARHALDPALRAVMESIQSKGVAAGIDHPLENEAGHFADRATLMPVPALTMARPSPATFSMQAKLEVGAVDDPLESEADHAAEHVMRMRDPAAITAASGGKVLRRKCDTCQCDACQDEKKKHPKLTRAGAHDAPAFDGTIAPAIVLDVLNSPGQALEPSTRAFFEPRFGHDLSGVRVHTDSRAAESAKSVGALAYAAGSDIVFGSNQYNRAGAGNRLLAHELAHTIQQRGGTSARKDANGGVRQSSGNAIRRAPAPTPAPLPATVPAPGPSDFEITRIANSNTSNIFFAKNSSALDTSAKTQISAIKTSAPSSVRLLGFSSADEKNTVAQARANAVKAELAASPNAVTVASAVGNAGAQESQSDFSQARKVEVVVGSATAATLDCKKKNKKGALVNPPKAPCPTMDPPTETAFKDALKIANDAMTRATTAVASTPNAADTAVIDKFFGNHDPGTLSTLKTNLGKLATHVSGLPGITSCGGQCDTGRCAEGWIAYNSGVDAASTMTVCVPTFKKLATDEDRARNLIHESAHGTSPLGGAVAPTKGTSDLAYRHERIIFQLPTADRLRNSDSYALFALHLRARQMAGKATAVPPGIDKPANDKISGFTVAGEQAAVEAAIAKLEKRLTWAKDRMGQLYGQMLKVMDGSLAWSASASKELMTEAAKRFPLSPPSAATPPTLKDQTLEAGILERYRRMHAALKRDLSITRVAAGIVSWGASSAGAWVAANTVEIGPEFFKATPANQISLLLEALAKKTRDVEPAFIPAYVSLAEWIHSKNP